MRRRADEIPSSDGGIHGQLKDSSRRKGIANGRSAGKISNRETVDGRRVISQLIQRGATGEPVYADVPEIGMNIAEQLYRLERRQDNRHFLPTNSFGWRFSTEMEMEEEFRIAVGQQKLTFDIYSFYIYFKRC